MTRLCDLSATEIAERLRAREVSAREVLAAHLDRIERVNPDVNAIVTLTAERAMREATAADDLLAGGQRVGPLHGLPFGFKDTDETAGIRTTHGSPLFADHVPARDDLVVERVRAAGAITVGKTNVPEFAAGSHTFNPIFGVTRNPYDLSRSAGGSSGGAAAALACGMLALADGSDMGGSLRNPANFCHVVGFRPSPGRVPNWPAMDPWSTMGVHGPMGRTVADAALLLSVQAGPDPRSPIAIEESGEVFAPPLHGDLRGMRVAWAPDLGGTVPVDDAVIDVLSAQVKVFEDLGARVEAACPDLTGADEVFLTKRARLFVRGLGMHLDRHPDQVKDTIAWNIRKGRDLTLGDVERARTLHAALFHRVREFFEHYDLLLAPVSQVVPFSADQEYPTRVGGRPMQSYLDWMRSAYLITATGCPALSVPAGLTPDGLPVGLQVVGPHHGDLAVLQAGYAFEQALPPVSRPMICKES